MAWLGAVCAIALVLAGRGAWPVPIFSLATVGLLDLCLRRFHASRPAGELLTLVPGEILHSRRGRNGTTAVVALPRFSTRLQICRSSDATVSVRLQSGGRVVPIGECLSVSERGELARLLRETLA
jgi:uncharacterized membrane protein